MVTATQRTEAAAIRDTDPKECDPNGDATVESYVLPVTLHEEVSPLLAKSLEDLPPAYVTTCEFDILRDEALLYVKRMKNAKPSIRVEHKQYNEHHDYMGTTMISDLAKYLRNNPKFL